MSRRALKPLVIRRACFCPLLTRRALVAQWWISGCNLVLISNCRVIVV